MKRHWLHRSGRGRVLPTPFPGPGSLKRQGVGGWEDLGAPLWSRLAIWPPGQCVLVMPSLPVFPSFLAFFSFELTLNIRGSWLIKRGLYCLKAITVVFWF